MIKVCDAIMGSGKSSAAITYMNEHKNDSKFIFITPFLEETKRIRECCPGLHFVEPSNNPKYDFKKLGHTEHLILEGRNISTTHSAFKLYTHDMLKAIKEQGYTLIIDENVDVLEQMEADPNDLKLVVENGFMEEADGEYKITDKEYDGTALLPGLLQVAKTRVLTRIKDGSDIFYYWSLPVDLITSFKDVFILTYMFDCQSICYFLKLNELSFEYIGVSKDSRGSYHFVDRDSDVPDYLATLKDKIHILENQKLNSIGDGWFDLSINWFSKESSDVEQLRKNIYNCYCNIWNAPASQRLWSTFKVAKSKLKAKGYTKAFLVFNSKATNNYKNKTCLVYATNIFMNVSTKSFYKRYNVQVSEEGYALSTMLQWIWRSAIREGKDINIYIPSKRMRTLLIDWINSVSGEGDKDEKV